MSNPWEPAAPDPQPSVPAGWYPDPAGSGGQRWWDGAQWTEHVQPPAAPAAPAAPVVPEAPAAPAAADDNPFAAPGDAIAAAPAAAEAAVPPPPAAPAAPAYGYQPAAAAPAYGGYAAAPAYNAYVQPRRVGFGEAISRAFKGWSDYSGRATLAEFWWFFLFQVILGIALYVVLIVAVLGAVATTSSVSADGSISSTSSGGLGAVGIIVMLLLVAVYLVLFLVSLALTVRRLHDTDKSGWFYLLVFIPFGSIILLVLCAMAGTPGPNRYGPVPQ